MTYYYSLNGINDFGILLRPLTLELLNPLKFNPYSLQFYEHLAKQGCPSVIEKNEKKVLLFVGCIPTLSFDQIDIRLPIGFPVSTREFQVADFEFSFQWILKPK